MQSNLIQALQSLKMDTVKMSLSLVKVNQSLTAVLDCITEDPDIKEINLRLADLGDSLSTFTDNLEEFEMHGRYFTGGTL